MNKLEVLNIINNYYNVALIALQDYIVDKEIYEKVNDELFKATIIVNKIYDNVITEKDYDNVYNKYFYLLKDVESFLDTKRKGM